MMTPKQIGKTISLPNRTVNGPVALASPIETYRSINFAQTTAGVSATLPNATDATVYFGVDLTNSGTEALTVNSVGALQPGKTLRAVWGTSGWNGQSILPRSFTHPNYTAGLNLWTPPIGVNAEDYGVMVFPQTSAGATLEFPNPSFASSNVTMDMVNSGTQPITIVSAASATIMTLLAGKSQYMTWDGNSWNPAPTAELASSLIDTSAATQTVTLPAATGSGATKLYANKAITNTGTLAVASGEKLNGVTDGAFLFSNYPAGTQFIVTDFKSGEWVVSVEGASTQTSLTRIQASFTADPSFPNGLSDVVFNAISFNGGIALTAGAFSIKAGKTYRLVADLRSYNIASGSPEFYWVNATTNAELVPNVGHGRNFPPAGGSNATAKSRAEVVYTAPADMTVKVRIECGNTHSIERLQSVAIIEELPTASAVLAGMVTPTALHYGAIAQTFGLALPAANTAIPMTVNSGDILGLATNAAAGSITVAQSGTYEVVGYLSMVGPNGWVITPYVNGVASTVVGRSVGNTATQENAGIAQGVLSLTAGDILTLRCNQGGASYFVFGASLSVKQLPTSAVVNPGTVPVTNLNWVSLSSVAPTSIDVPSAAGFTQLSSAAVTKRDPGNMVVADVTGDYILIPAAGRYQVVFAGAPSPGENIKLQLNGTIVAVSVGINSHETAALNYTANLSAGDRLRLECTQAMGRFSMSVTQLATQSVIAPGSVAVNDQAASGYFDIGSMRMQWGVAVNVGHDAVITLPAPFLNTSYAINGTADNDTGNKTTVGLVTYGAKTASNFQIGYVDSRDSTGGSNATISWFAIGRKP